METNLLNAAKLVAKNAYSPYSMLNVGAAILTRRGAVFTGCNIENPSYGVSLCAERAALAAMVSSEGPQARIALVAVWSAKDNPCFPCGICRQALLPFCDENTALVTEAEGKPEPHNFAGLLPNAFTGW